VSKVLKEFGAPVINMMCIFQVFDIVIHRYIELPQTPSGKGLEMLLDFLGELYKFHSECL